VLVGITAALAGMWIVDVANGYIFANKNMSTAQKAQLAMTRLVKEFEAINSIDTASTNGTQIRYTRTDNTLGTTPYYTVSVTVSGTLQLAGNTLTDTVSAFALRYCGESELNYATCPRVSWQPAGVTEPSRIIEISLTLTAGDNIPVTFVQRVIPRNL
jgi:hypothetical protein